MPSTVREQILTAIAARCETLSGNPVVRCRRSMPVSKEPFVSLWDGASVSVGVQYGIQRSQFLFSIEAAWIPVDEASVEANAMMGTIEALIMTNGWLDRDMVKKIDWQNSQPNYPTDGSNVVTVQATFQIEYSTPIGDPYTNATP
jgi:hypothetical protein